MVCFGIRSFSLPFLLKDCIICIGGAFEPLVEPVRHPRPPLVLRCAADLADGSLGGSRRVQSVSVAQPNEPYFASDMAARRYCFSMSHCRGQYPGGTPCVSDDTFDNGYCVVHQSQAPDWVQPPTPRHWTRKQLEDAIHQHGGMPMGLNLGDIDLSGEDLSGMKLTGIILTRSDKDQTFFVGANFEKTNLTDAWLIAARLRGGNFQQSVLNRADMKAADLRNSNFSWAEMHGVDLQRARLQSAWLIKAKLNPNGAIPAANHSVANLQNARLIEAELQEVSFVQADMQNADLRMARLQGANLEVADLRGADMTRANLRGANLRSADLRGVDLLRLAEDGLLEVSLYQAKLEGTRLRRQQLGRAVKEELGGEFGKAREIYFCLRLNFRDLGDSEAVSWTYFKEREMERLCNVPGQARQYFGREELGDFPGIELSQINPRVLCFHLRHSVKWYLDWWVELVCGYGERPWRTVAALVIVFFAFLLLYMVTGAVVRVDSVTQQAASPDFLELAVFTLAGFTTVDMGGLEPRTILAQLALGVEALVGVVLVALLGFMVAKHITRS